VSESPRQRWPAWPAENSAGATSAVRFGPEADIQWRPLDHFVGAREQNSQDPTRWMPCGVFIIDFIVGKDALIRSLPHHIVNRPICEAGLVYFNLSAEIELMIRFWVPHSNLGTKIPRCSW
jgi:hypothetical protein